MITTFITLVFIVFYAYFGYPIVLLFISNFRKIPLQKTVAPKNQNDNLPDIDLLIAAFNEEKVIGSKILNSLELDYPREKLKIYVVSDGSTDMTNDIVRDYSVRNSNVNLIPFARIGKSAAINKAMKSLNGEIVVFSDANTEFEKGALKKIIKNFSIEGV